MIIASDNIYDKVRELFPDLPKNCRKAVITLEQGCIVQLKASFYTDPPVLWPIPTPPEDQLEEGSIDLSLKIDAMVDKALGSLDAFLDEKTLVLALEVDRDVGGFAWRAWEYVEKDPKFNSNKQFVHV